MRFFKKWTVHIEIVRDNKVEKIYFPKLPFCQNNFATLKKKFHSKYRPTIKMKITDLIACKEEVIKEMKYEEKQ